MLWTNYIFDRIKRNHSDGMAGVSGKYTDKFRKKHHGGNPTAGSEEKNHDSGDMKRQLEEIVAQNVEYQKQVEDYKNKWMTVRADIANLHKRFENEKADIKNYANKSMAIDISELRENFGIALRSINADLLSDPKVAEIYKGIEMIEKMFDRALEKNGVVRALPERGDDFDHSIHHAIRKVVADDVEPGKIVDVIKSGYLLNSRVIVPAMVTVAEVAEEGGE